MLKSELEKLKQEKESNQLIIENFDNASKSLEKLIGSQTPNKSKKGVGFVSYNVVPPPPIGLFSPPNLDLSYSSLEEFQQLKFEGYGPKPSKSVSEDTSNEFRESPDAPLIEELVSDDKLKKKTIFPTVDKIEFVRPKQQEKPVRKLVKYAEMYRNMVPRAVLMKIVPRSLNTARPVNTAHPKTTVYSARPMVIHKKKIKAMLTVDAQAHENREHVPISPDYKNLMEISDESQVLLKVPRKNNMYSVDMKNIVPKESLTCLVAKATLDESMLWHRRLGHNRVLIVKPHNKTPYELFRGRTPVLSFMRQFGCHVTILTTLDYLGKFDGKSDEGFFVGYSLNSKAFRVPVVAGTNSNDLVGTEESIGADDAEKKDDEGVNKESGIDDQERPKNSTQDVNTVGPSINTASTNVNTGSLNINIVSPTITTAPLEVTHADFFGDKTELDMSNITTTYLVYSTPNTRIHKDHSLDHVIGDVQFGEETKKVIQALKDPSWIEAMQEELLQFKLQQVWTLVDLPHGKRDIGTKLVYRNKKDERVARIEEIRLFLAYASFKDFVVYQMNMKSEFLYGKIEEEVYVCQPPGFEDPKFPDRVYKVEKALYDLHQALRAWYETLSTYLLDNGFQRGQIDKTLFIKRDKSDIILVQISSMGELTFFLGLQVTQRDDGIFISQDKYVDGILKKFGFLTVKTASTPMETSKPLIKDENAEDIDVHLYRSMIGSLMYLTSSRPDIMFVVCACARFQVTPKVSHLHVVKRIFRYLKDMKSTTGGCQFLGSRSISYKCKKQTIVANSTTEAEYVAASSCCGQVLWIQNQMLDYGYNFMNTKIFIDNESTIYIVKNLVFHSNTKHLN
ncbi:putative ribonuclease H-like domain-containing protein [Tanacetum coccineum]